MLTQMTKGVKMTYCIIPKDSPSRSESSLDPKSIRIGRPNLSVQSSHSATILSDKPLADWQASVTKFNGFTGTRPVKELGNASWDQISNQLRPAQPARLEDKKGGQYFVPCLLKEAPLVGKTLEAAQHNGDPLIGKMRSKSHVTLASLLIIDIDGLPEPEFFAILDWLKPDGITFLAYTTHSHGREDKPGMRVRLCIPVDRPLNIEEYAAAWHGFNQICCNGTVSKADASGANMYQQQGLWCCHPSRADKAKSWEHKAGIASADVLVAAGQPKITRTQPTDEPSKTPQSKVVVALRDDVFLPIKIVELLKFIDPDIGYDDWLRVGMALFHQTKSSEEGMTLFDRWSSAGDKYKGIKEIEAKWRSFRPDIANPVTIRTLIMMARDAGADTSAIMGDSFTICEYEVVAA
ncbi:MAG: PriCT-2 domain-containing protein [Desulfurivibrionaceae bacterium]